MSQDKAKNWDPGTYARFRDFRLRPALDLMAQIGPQIGAVPEGPQGPVVDLGCGDGAVAAALADRFPDRPLIGVDNSPAMLAKAAESGAYAGLVEADIGAWQAEAPPAVIFSNAALHWLDGHDVLMPRLARMLAPGGVLAVQIPGQSEAPSHALLRAVADEMFPGRVSATAARAGAAWMPADYARLLSGLGAVTAWETSYVQPLAPVGAAHPVRRFTEATAMLPFLAVLNEEEAGRFLSAYEAELAAAYPAEADGTVLFPFRRVFFTLTLRR